MGTPAAQSSAPPTPASRAGWLLLIPLALAAAAYARSIRGGFQFDDLHAVERNPAIRELPALLRALPGALLAGGRPVADFTLALNHAAGRLEPAGYHLVNLALHLAAAGLVFAFTRAVLRRAAAAGATPVAVAVAGVFALHPLQTEAVSYVCQRAEVLASGFYLLALLLLLAAERAPVGRAAALAAGALAATAFALGSKATAVTIPAAALLLAAGAPVAVDRPARWGRWLAWLAPATAMCAWLAAATLRGAEGTSDAGYAVPGVTPGAYLLTQVRVLLTALRLVAWPAGQSVDWGYPVAHGIDAATVAAGLALAALVGAAAVAWWGARRDAGADGAARRVAALGVAWFFLVLAPTSTVVPLADPLAEHRYYLALWGPVVAAAVLTERGFARLPTARRGAAAWALVALTWGALALATHRRNAVWEGAGPLWADAAARAPHNPRARMNHGQALRAAGDVEGALREHRAAVALASAEARWAPLRSQTLNHLGATLAGAGLLDEGEAALRAALEARPRDGDARANLAVLAFKRGQHAEARDAALRALEVAPDHGMALQVLGSSRLLLGDEAGALEAFRQAAEADPEDPQRRYNLGLGYEAVGRTAEACRAYAEALAGGATAAMARQRAGRLGCPAP